MKLILTADVDHLGSVGDTVEVKDGYGRNFLLPRGLGIVASRGDIGVVALDRRNHRLDRQAEDVADPKREVEAWKMIGSLQSAHGLRIEVDQRRELCSRHPPLGAQVSP